MTTVSHASKHLRFVAALAAIVTVVAALGLGAAVAQDGEVVEVEMTASDGVYYFDPVGLHVEPGTTIRFVNVRDVHNTLSYSEDNGKPQRIPDGADGWASPMFTEEGGTFEVTLSEEGVYDYFCQPHEALGMVGRIVVGDPEAFPARDPGELQFDAAADALPSVDAIMADEDGRLTFEEANAD
ncbi:MAG: plastocyanin/azurin family copper-binding protein [Trueperaceae bacterium]|nr:plastocyanin/azurin family copper-binding protein [Trueperaceae bacterium]